MQYAKGHGQAAAPAVLRMRGACGLLLLLSAATLAAQDPVPVSLSSLHDSVPINGQLDMARGSSRKATVLMIPGSGRFDRDVILAKPSLENSRIFRAVAETLTSRGVATVRYDTRAYECAVARNCATAATAITPAAMQADIRSLAEWIVAQGTATCLPGRSNRRASR